MEIRNVTQFASFISSNGFNNLDGIFIQIIQCVNTYSAACNCYKVEDKRKIYSMCCKLYLRLYHNSFFVRLITCPICLSVWLGIIVSMFTSISLIPLSIVGGLLLFTIIDKLLG